MRNTVNNELSNISLLFNSNKLSLNADKTKFTLFHNVRQKDNIPLVSPILAINNTLVKRIDHIKSLGVLFVENLTWENQISKSLGIRYRIFVRPEIKGKCLFFFYTQLHKLW